MAKVKAATTDNAEQAAVPAEKPAKAAKAPRAEKVYEFVKDLEQGQKFAPQAMIIIKTIQESNKISRSDLESKLAANENFKTRQPVGRIVSYYEKDIVNSGVVKVA
jgi:hypothetical protein